MDRASTRPELWSPTMPQSSSAGLRVRTFQEAESSLPERSICSRSMSLVYTASTLGLRRAASPTVSCSGGAASVIAVDVGYGQLAHKLRIDSRVRVMERTNGRALTPLAIGGHADLTVVDASFIGLAKLVSAIATCTRPGGTLVALVKPQFEVGREEASRTRGVVRDESVRAVAVAGAMRSVRDAGFDIRMQGDSVLPGPKGNREVFLHATRL